jgi:hypothetical protein
LLQVDPGDAEEGTTAMLTTINDDGILDPVCISRRERFLRVCPFLSTAKGFVAAGCVDFQGRRMPAVGGKFVDGRLVLDLVGWGSVPTRFVLDANGAFQPRTP